MAVPANPLRAPPKRSTHRSHETARRLFLQTLCKGLSVSAGAQVAGTERRKFYCWRDGNNGHEPSMLVPGFKEAWDEALEIGVDRLEDEAFRRAHDGIDKPIYYQGERVDVIREYSDNLLKFLLEGRRSRVYRPKVDDNGGAEVKIVVVGGLPIKGDGK